MEIIIISPSLNPQLNVSGISAVTQFIINNNPLVKYIHFELGRKDNENQGINRVFTILKNLKDWTKILRKYPNAYIHYNFPLSKASILRDPLFIYIALLQKKKILIHVHGGVFLTSPKVPFILNYILKKIFALNIPFIVLSELEKKILQKKYNCKNIQVLPNCVDLNEATSFKKEFHHDKPLTIGYLGRIAQTKGMDFLISSCMQLKEKGIPFTLKIAGKEENEGEYLNRFNIELGKQFVYEGIVFGESKNKFLKSLDLFILPSFFEGLPMSLLECMSYGVVPITTNVGSISEVVQDEINGLFIHCKDAHSISEKIIYLHKHRDIINKLSENAKQTIFDSFSPSSYINNLNILYNNL